MRIFFLASFAFLTTFASGGIIDWGLYASSAPASQAFYNQWSGATVYTYLMVGASADTASSFIKSWTSSYVATGSVEGGSTGAWGSDIQKGTLTTDNYKATGHFVVILQKADGTAIGSYVDKWNTRESPSTPLVESNAALFGDVDEKNESGYLTLDETGQPLGYTGATGSSWISVPEPGMLALLALGVAGLALRRKVA